MNGSGGGRRRRIAVLAYFTKAAAAFYPAALGLAALWSFAAPRESSAEHRGRERSAAFWTLAGLGVTTVVVALVFVLPHWADYRFYNWHSRSRASRRTI